MHFKKSPKTYQKLMMVALIRQHTLYLNNNLKHARELGLTAEFFINENSKLEVIITDPSRHRKRNFYESQDGNFYTQIIGRLKALYKLRRMKYGEHREQAKSYIVDK